MHRPADSHQPTARNAALLIGRVRGLAGVVGGLLSSTLLLLLLTGVSGSPVSGGSARVSDVASALTGPGQRSQTAPVTSRISESRPSAGRVSAVLGAAAKAAAQRPAGKPSHQLAPGLAATAGWQPASGFVDDTFIAVQDDVLRAVLRSNRGRAPPPAGLLLR